MKPLPLDAPADLVPFEPSARRTLELMGSPVELVLAPERSQRSGQVGSRPAMQRSPAERIIREEAYWSGNGVVLTPNKYPFGKDHRLLWIGAQSRDPDINFWASALDWVDRSGGTVLLNNIGAAATIARAHAHLIHERLPFLDNLPERPLTADLIDVPVDCELLAKDLPICIVGVRGPAFGRAAALMRLSEARLTACWNVVLADETAWIVPRSIETPAPWFSKPVGAAEMWGRWCYVDEREFESASAENLEQALRQATMPALVEGSTA